MLELSAGCGNTPGMEAGNVWQVESEPQPEAARPPRVPLGTVVSKQIRDRITEHALGPGTALPSESALAREFGVSVRVVRDALRMLSNQGIVETRQGKRAVVGNLRPVAMEQYFEFVVSTTTDGLAELLDVRLALETQAAAAAARNASDEEIAELRRLLDAVLAAGDDVAVRAPADVEFHRAIARASRNRFFVGILDALREALEDERKRGGTLPGSHDETNAQHEALLAAVERRDPAAAEQAMRAILERARQYFGTPARRSDGVRRRRAGRRSSAKSG